MATTATPQVISPGAVQFPAHPELAGQRLGAPGGAPSVTTEAPTKVEQHSSVPEGVDVDALAASLAASHTAAAQAATEFARRRAAQQQAEAALDGFDAAVAAWEATWRSRGR